MAGLRRIVAVLLCLTLGPGWMSAMYLFYFGLDATDYTSTTACWRSAIACNWRTGRRAGLS